MDSTLQSDSGQASSPRVELNEVLAGHIQTSLGASYPDYRVTKVCVPDCPACLIDQILALEPIASLLKLYEKAQAGGYRVAVVDDKAELPRFIYFEASRYTYGLAQQEMLQAGYVKEVEW